MLTLNRSNPKKLKFIKYFIEPLHQFINIGNHLGKSLVFLQPYLVYNQHLYQLLALSYLKHSAILPNTFNQEF